MVETAVKSQQAIIQRYLSTRFREVIYKMKGVEVRGLELLIQPYLYQEMFDR